MKLPTVAEHMDTVVHTLPPETPILRAVSWMLDWHVTGVPVVDGAMRLKGIITEKDCLKLLSLGRDGEPITGTVADYMTREVTTVPPSMDIYFAAGIFLSKSFRRLVVVNNDRVVGAITRFDLLRAIRDNYAPRTKR